MKAFYVAGVVLCALVSFAYSLDCYRCKDCLPAELSFLSDTTECENRGLLDQAKCFKEVKQDGTINRGCTYSSNCVAELDKLCLGSSDKDCYVCCGTDECNSSSTLSSSIVICLTSLLFFIVLL